MIKVKIITISRSYSNGRAHAVVGLIVTGVMVSWGQSKGCIVSWDYIKEVYGIMGLYSK